MPAVGRGPAACRACRRSRAVRRPARRSAPLALRRILAARSRIVNLPSRACVSAADTPPINAISRTLGSRLIARIDRRWARYRLRLTSSTKSFGARACTSYGNSPACRLQTRSLAGEVGNMGHPTRHEADVIVVGAGLSGMIAARRLLEAGLTPLVLEADERVGGRILTEEVIAGRAGRTRRAVDRRHP